MQQGNGSLIPRSTQRTEDFFRQTLNLVESEIQQKTFDRSYPSVHFLPGQAPSCFFSIKAQDMALYNIGFRQNRRP